MNTVDTSHWYIVVTEPKREGRAVAGLVARRFEAFGPSIYTKAVVKKCGVEVKDQHGRKIYKRIDRPMFPGYVFVRSASARGRFAEARRVVGVSRFMFAGEDAEGRPQLATLPGALMDAIRREEERYLSAYEDGARTSYGLGIPFVVGGQARIEGGPYDDWLGTMLKQKKNGRLQMLINQFGRETKIEVDAAQVRAA